jgi:hypothetical protein
MINSPNRLFVISVLSLSFITVGPVIAQDTTMQDSTTVRTEQRWTTSSSSYETVNGRMVGGRYRRVEKWGRVCDMPWTPGVNHELWSPGAHRPMFYCDEVATKGNASLPNRALTAMSPECPVLFSL